MLVNNLIPQIDTTALLNTIEPGTSTKHQVSLDRKIVVKDQTDCIFLEFDSIIHLEAHGAYTKVYMLNEEPLLISKNIKSFAAKLNMNEFVRVHKSFIININHVSRYVRRSASYVILTNGTEIPVAVRRKDVFDALVEDVLL